MYLRQISLTNFRNYRRLSLNLEPGVTAFVGENAQGKSNLLEAVHVLATTKSLRAGVDRELVAWEVLREEGPFTRLEARVARDTGGLHVELLIRPTASPQALLAQAAPGKVIRVNGLPNRASDLVGQVNVVLFSPEDLLLVTGPPSGRRRYLDLTNAQVSRSYLRALQRLNRLLVQRNNLLRQVRERRQPVDQLLAWNEELVTLGSEVVLARLRMVEAVNRSLGDCFRTVSGAPEELELEYACTAFGAAETSAGGGFVSAPETIAERMRARLAEVQSREIEQAVSLVGPHRDDFAFRLSGVDLGAFGSRGQQRLAVLALKLAEQRFLKAETGEQPILLLDDVLSELDPSRRAAVLRQVTEANGQTLLTLTSLNDLEPNLLPGARLLRVSSGTVSPLNGGV